jgi:hypothetical protein
MPINLSGSLVLTGSIVATGGITMSGSIASASYALSSSYTANADLLDNRDSLTFANTGSNTFSGGQYISSSFNPTGFSTTASLYTDGGLRVTKDAYISGTLYLNNVTVYGTQSVCYITSSQLNIASNLISVNTATPSVRFGGLAVYDSGSTGLTGSILWDSENNRWIYSNPSGSSYDGGMFISGPRNSSGLGSETGTTACMLLAGQGGDHLTSSMIYHSSTVTCIPNTLIGSTICSTMGNHSCMGIGTMTPSYPLDVSGSAVRLKNAGGSADFILDRGSTSAGATSQYVTAGTLKWYTGLRGLANDNLYIFNNATSTNTLVLDSSTNAATFACSIIAASNILNFNASSGTPSTSNSLWMSESSNGTGCCWQLYIGGSGNSFPGGLGVLINGNAKMIFTAGGNVGIGLTNPTAQLHICSAYSQTPLTVQGGGNGNVPIACFMSGPNQLALLDDNGNWILGGTSFSTRSTCTSGGLFTSGRVGLGTTNIGSEANLYLGAQGTVEGGQLVLQKATNCNCATHLDNYEDKFRIMSGTNTGSTTVNMVIDHTTKNVCFYGQVRTICGINSVFNNGSGDRYNFTNLNTPQDLVGICANNGLIVFRDHTAGGTGVFLIDPNQGVICIASNIPATVSIAWIGSVWRWCLTSGGVPRCLGYGFYGA